jgi:hypothetical protein
MKDHYDLKKIGSILAVALLSFILMVAVIYKNYGLGSSSMTDKEKLEECDKRIDHDKH